MSEDKKQLIEEFFIAWGDFSNKVFTWKREFLPNEYLLVRKDQDGNFTIDERESTRSIKPFDKAIMKQMMLEGYLVFKCEYSYYMKLLDFKTEGCTCGLWALGPNAGKHDIGCNKRGHGQL